MRAYTHILARTRSRTHVRAHTRTHAQIHLRGATHTTLCVLFRYTVEGMNIVLVNLMVFVVLAIFFGYIDHLEGAAGQEIVFILAVLSVIPLAYYM